ncbi:MAG TPA: polysaccharide deacetylase family protein [Mycobacteriales bacterium]|jgi:peptidoglycan/xylan/chitin deacetylase (PgdA/CDA1 family)|nr:polysaccharide deacetylase family protein [Mycobacteriales bacterium]
MSPRPLVVAAGVLAAVQVGPAATWLPPLRRALAPSLEGRGPAGTVAVSFDDGPHPDGTPAVLDALDALDWRATFFVLGEQVRRYPELVTETVRRGHAVALHGDSHRYLIGRTPGAAMRDLRRGRDTIADLLGTPPSRWRPPYGVLSGPALIAARTLRLQPVLWSSWGRDWRAGATPTTVVSDLLTGSPDGGMLLLHDSDLMSAPGSWRVTVAALPLLAEQLATRGLVARSPHR